MPIVHAHDSSSSFPSLLHRTHPSPNPNPNPNALHYKHHVHAVTHRLSHPTTPPPFMLYKDVSSHRKMREDWECPSMTLVSGSDSNSGSSYNGEGGAVSTSENADAIYEGKEEPERDLMKKMMRMTCSKLASNVRV
ncbi:hypothetical protein PVL29_014704 [Vitis rotundifolia]|uniref:Uncharacterized protein n=1 Tax=Vitis rotundifolia TaxID=103349 RepID=A0AA38ZHT8_VITRO|nr:hypothetical protein PVL29_014704 [Vitis rotundifolia]